MVQIVGAVAKKGGSHDLGQLLVEVDQALRGKFIPKLPTTVFQPFKPTRSAAPAAEVEHEKGKRWPYTCPARPDDIKHSLGDGSRLRCFENGQWVRDLVPILRARGLTPAKYRRKWGLPRNYPMQSKAELEARAQQMPWAKRRPTADEIRNSISQTTLISFEDGGHYKSLTRHLTSRGLTPETYRAKWGLPDDYPMMPPKVMDSYRERGRTSGAKNLEPRRKGDPRFKKAKAPGGTSGQEQR